MHIRSHGESEYAAIARLQSSPVNYCIKVSIYLIINTHTDFRYSFTGPSHLGVYGPCGFIRCVIEKAKKTARLGSESSAFDGRVLLGLDRLGLNPVSQRHVTSGSRAGVWLICF